MLITFEGIDGSGKSTQLELFEKYILQSVGDVYSTKAPGGTLVGQDLRKILSSNLELSSETILELMLLDQKLLCKELKPILQNGITVLCDRFSDSTRAYQGYGQEINLEYLENRIRENCDLVPDLTVLLDLPVQSCIERMKQIDRFEKQGFEFFGKVRYGYLEIAKKYPERIAVVGVYNKTPIEIHEEICQIYNQRFSM